MAINDKLFAGSIPELYDRYLVPLIFEPYALDLAERLAKAGPRDILEIAAGTGVLTRTMASKLPMETRIVATDLNQPMLDYAAARQLGGGRITWRQADGSMLPFEDAMFDAVACQFGAMFFPDKVQAYREARRVLRPGGNYIFNVWDRISENEFADVVTKALVPLFPNDPPRFLARTPHGYYNKDQIHAELTAAGFSAISIDTVKFMSRSLTAGDVASAYCQGTPLRNEIEARGSGWLDRATKIATAALEHRFGKGPIEGHIGAHVITAAR
jgi:ubiquinone/menaquinone biosynthesis C-methylase UbiE